MSAVTDSKRLPTLLFSIILFSAALFCMPARGSATAGHAASDSLELARDHATRYRIAVAPRANAVERRAAALLQSYLKRVTGAEFPLDSSGAGADPHAIWIASAAGGRHCPIQVRWDRLEEDGFLIESSGDRIVIAGGRDKGVIYGICSFLESSLGCRKYSPAVEAVPVRGTVVLGPLRDEQVPVIRFRDASRYDPAYMEWQKLDNHDHLFGMYVHTFHRLVPPETHFARHPEYYSLLPGGRVPDAQLCLSQPGVLRVVVEELERAMMRRPEARTWSVSQNDTYSPCGCEACRRVDSAEGSPSGSLLAFVNRVAQRFPEKIISTLAYQYSRSAPAHIVPEKNVSIMLCSIECNRSRPIATDPSSASFRKDVEDWTRLTDNIYLWDYVVQFRNLVSPFPNLRVLQPNIRYFARHGIRAIFEQGVTQAPNEFKELRGYLIAKLLWNPDVNIDSVMNDFLAGFYGAAAPQLRRYIDAMHDALESSGEDLLIYGYPAPSKDGYLSAANMLRYAALFDSAEAAVAGDPLLLDRVREARLPLQFAELEQAKILGTGSRGFFESDGSGGWRVRHAMRSLLETFIARCALYGVGALDESGYTPAQYMATTRAFLDGSMKRHLALFRPVALDPQASSKYHNGEAAALTDGLKGWNDYRMHWLGFEGEDMSAVVDLGPDAVIRAVRMNALQDNNSWIFLPTSVEFSVSDDGVQFRSIASQLLPNRERETGAFIHPLALMCEPVPARYLKVTAVNRKACPAWHKGAGGKAWIFVDEIEVY